MNPVNEMSAIQTTDFRIYLQTVLSDRCKKNPSYSLRAFAASLKIDHSYLSQLLRGKRRFSRKMKIRLGKELGLGPNEVMGFLNHQEGQAVQLSQREIDQFISISDWYYDAICELTQLDEFVPDTKWIARVLDITPSEVNMAVERLVRMGELEITNEGRWIASTETQSEQAVSEEYADVARKKHQKQILTKAYEAIDAVDFDERFNASSTFAVKKERVGEVKALVNRFVGEFQKLVENDEQKDNVYELAVSLFPLTKSNKTVVVEEAVRPTLQ